MKNRLYAAGAVGIVVGFILGFFTAQFQKREPVVAPIQQTGAPQSSQSGLPQGHPPAEVLEELGKLQKRAEEHPEDKQVRIVLGNSYYDMGRFDAAVSWYQQALDLDPENLNVRTDLGTAQLYQGKVSEAIRTYKHCLKLDPNHPQTLQNLGIAYFSTGNFASAIDTWETLLGDHPQYPHKEEIRKQLENARKHVQEGRS